MIRRLFVLVPAVIALGVSSAAAQSDPFHPSAAPVAAPRAPAHQDSAAMARARDDKTERDAAKVFRLERSRDDFAKTSFTDLRLPIAGHSVVQCSGDQIATLGLRLRYFTTPETTGTILTIAYSGDEWLFIDSEQPLDMLIDSARTQLPIAMQPGRDVRYRTVIEVGTYLVDTDVLHRIAGADSVRVRLWGNKGHCDFSLDAKGRRLVALFADSVIVHRASAGPGAAPARAP